MWIGRPKRQNTRRSLVKMLRALKAEAHHTVYSSDCGGLSDLFCTFVLRTFREDREAVNMAVVVTPCLSGTKAASRVELVELLLI